MTDSDIEENQNEKNEEALCELRSEILQEVTLTHPICYDICDLIANSKLSNFAIQMLHKICEHFDIPITDIKVQRKAPYIERLIAFGKNAHVRYHCDSYFRLNDDMPEHSRAHNHNTQ